MVAGSVCLLAAIMYIPIPHKIKLRVMYRVHSESFDDINQYAKWTYVLIARNGKPYYFQTDDDEYPTKGETYVCSVMGNKVRYVVDYAKKRIRTRYRPCVNCSGLALAWFLFLPAIIAFEYVDIWWAAASITWGLVVVSLGILRYLHKGDV